MFSAHRIVDERLGQVQPAVKQHLKTGGRITEMHPHAAVVDLAAIPVVLPAHPHGVATALGRARLVDAADRCGMSLFAGPMSNAVIVGFLRGQQTPVVETSQADFKKLGIQLRVYLDYGCALGDSRGALKATGASAG